MLGNPTNDILPLLGRASWRRRDLVKFLIFTTLFSLLILAFEKAYSPEWFEVFNSASTSQGGVSKDEGGRNLVIASSKNKTRNILTLSTNPDSIVVNQTFLKALLYNLESAKFINKVTPLWLTIDKTRSDPRGQVAGGKMMIS